MSFELIVPVRGGSRRPSDNEVRVSMYKNEKSKGALELCVVIGAGLVEQLGLSKGQRINLGVGGEASPQRGQLAIMPAEDGHFRLGAAGRNLQVKTRTLHPCLKLAPLAQIVAERIQISAERMVIRLPDAMLRQRPISGSLMGDPPVRQRA